MREPGRRDEEDTRRSEGGKPSSLRAVVDALRSIPERMKRPESMLMILMIMASLGAHMPPYLSLGALADYFKAKEKEQAAEKAPPVTFEVLDKAEEPKPVEPPKPLTPRERSAKKKEEQKKKVEEQKKAVEEKKQVAELTPPEPPKQQQPPIKPREDRKQSITQKSQDPTVEPPPDPKFLAEESQRVEEETVASVTSETKNDPDPQAAAPQAAGPEKSGDSHADERGAEKGQKSEQQQTVASRERSQDNNPRPPSPTNTPAPPSLPQRSTPPGPVAPKTAPAEQVFHDPLGSFTLAASDPSQAPAGAQGSGAAGKPANIKVSWHAFEQTFGAEQLAQDRMPKEAKRRGAGREKRWEEFRASIENYVVGVKPGNQTKLNAAADPFAAYLAAFHRNLHIEFAHDFLASLPMAGDLGNPELVTMVEIVVNADGTLDRVGVVKASGNLMYDFGAFNAVQRGAPYPPTPEKIRSPDGRVYIKWALHRNESQCGTWNAEPFILKNPPRSPNDPKQDNVSPYRPGATGNAPGGSQGGTPGKAPGLTHDETLGLLDNRFAPTRG
ncbi:MAG: Exopolysaccharide biosynthesis domain protein [Myxococcaceae bacterium]|nr:Exopolysaccharide biosynthesis domain protein [Myxococcaceae bacterium]